VESQALRSIIFLVEVKSDKIGQVKGTVLNQQTLGGLNAKQGMGPVFWI
jgi:hypothetical protein